MVALSRCCDPLCVLFELRSIRSRFNWACKVSFGHLFHTWCIVPLHTLAHTFEISEGQNDATHMDTVLPSSALSPLEACCTILHLR